MLLVKIVLNMVKEKYTLLLALMMLFVGVNVVDAQRYAKGLYGSYSYYPEDGFTANLVINRNISIDGMGDVTVSPQTGEYGKHILAGADFSFDVEGDADVELDVIVVIADENVNFLEDKYSWTEENGGIILTKTALGKWKVTIVDVRANMTIKVDRKTTTTSRIGSGDQEGSEAFAEDKVWGSSGTLYVKAANSGVLYIYNVAGQLCKTVSISGDYSLLMSKGLYIVRFNNKAYRIKL